MKLRKYRMLNDSQIEKSVQKGAVVYDCAYYDYGVAGDDTRMLGEPHISVTLSESGDYPFFTVPTRDLEEISA